jgi:hypothetical protein
MKRIFSIFAMLFLVFSFCTVAIAEDSEPVADNTNEGADAGRAIELTDGNGNDLILNFSPSVNAIYETDAGDPDGNKQWYAVATYHSGGTFFFGSSSDSTVVYRKSRDTTEEFSDAGVPDAKAGPDETADSIWTDAGWSK